MSISNSNISPLIYRSQPNPAIHQPGTLATPVELTIFNDGESHRRHDRQLSDGKIAKLNDSLPGLIIDAREYCACYEVPNEVILLANYLWWGKATTIWACKRLEVGLSRLSYRCNSSLVGRRSPESEFASSIRSMDEIKGAQR